MTIQLYANNAKTTLASGINSTQTTITVAPGTGVLFPNPSSGQVFRITLVSSVTSTVYEICTCTSRSGDVLTVIRGQEGTSGTSFLTGDIVGNYDTAGVMADLLQSEQLQNQYYQYGVAAGTANALTATVPSNLSVIPDGMYMTIISAYANTGTVSLNLTLGSTILGVYPIVKGNNVALASGDIPGAGYPIQLNWSNAYSSYVMSNPATGILITTVPTGSIAMFPATTPPSGYLIAEGQLVSRSTYAALWTFAQASGNIVSDSTWSSGQYGSFSTGDGSTTFRLPQFGGYFLRALDNGNGIDPSRAIGTVQQNQNQIHTHTATSTSSVTDPGHNHLSNAVGLINGTINWVGTGGTPYNNGNNTFTSPSVTGITVNTTTTNDSNGGSEARPVNIAVLTCIKY